MTRAELTFPVDALVSYHYYRDDNTMAALARTGRLRLIGDSGAFSAMTQGAHIDLDDYAAWCQRWRSHLFWTASLDVIGDPEATYRNWLTLRDRHNMVTVPTIHAGTEARWLDVYAREGVDLVGLGGMAGTGAAPRAFRWAVHMFRYARDRWPDVRYHLWGVTNRQFLDNLPTYSADSSGVLGSAYRYAQLRVFDPASGRHHNVELRGGGAIYRIGPLLRRVYGVDPAEIARSTPANRATLIRLATASTQQYAAWLQRRHQVTPPLRSVHAGAPTGTRVHVVAGTKQQSGNNDLDAVIGGPLLHLVSANGGGV